MREGRCNHCGCKGCRENRKRKKDEIYYPLQPGSWGCCNLRYLAILILIILQFGKREEYTIEGEGKYHEPQMIDNSILFIIAMYFLSCCIPCR